ncbi:hypothetical protein BH11PSE3_BH11PSE3_43680 [soil metagenome]
MSQHAADNHDVAYFGAPSTRTLVTRNLGRGVVSFNRLRAEDALGQIDDSAVEDAIMVAYQHSAVTAHVFLEGRHVRVPGQSQDRITVYDYRHRWSCDIKTAYEATNFYIPRAILNAVSNEAGRSGDLRLKPGQSASPGAPLSSTGTPRLRKAATSSALPRSPGRKAAGRSS